MSELVFVGLGLHDELGISISGMNEVRSADSVFIELYTSLLPGFSPAKFEKTSGKKLTLLSRKDLEEDNGGIVLDAAKHGKAVLLVPGDPLVATTHVSLRIEAKKRGVRSRIVHGASILSAVIGLSGLHNYKFGKSVTIPFPEDITPETPYSVIAQNKQRGLHTLCLLDIKADDKRYLSIQQGLEELLKVETRRKANIVTLNAIVVGIARAGSKKPTVKAGSVKDLLTYDFGKPPYSLIFPGQLHFMEVEALIAFGGASEKLRGIAQ